MQFEKIVQFTYHNMFPSNNIRFEKAFSFTLTFFVSNILFLNSGLVGVPAFQWAIMEFLCLLGYTRYAWVEVGLLHSLPYGDVS